MGFGDIKTTEGVKALNEYMADKSYIEGFVPSQADVAMFQALDGAPAACFPHALRWYKHIKSYEKSASSLPGVQKPLGQYGPAGCDAVPAATNTKGRKSDDDDDDDDLDLFGSDEENEESKTIREERLAQYAAKKSNKPKVIAKSSVVLDVKPWDDETDMAEVEKHVRSVVMDGLIWGASKLVPVGYGIKKLQMQCVIEDDKVSICGFLKFRY
uniref:Elongation factor 1-beta n=1 Tax=Eptatretus burgeri TaxID=7764 RepID=A0A8C4Q3G4_EPTBU